MGGMTMPHDPGETPPPPPAYIPQQIPTESRRGITGGAHTVHAVLTVCTCGVWGFVWLLHWLFTRSKTTYR